MLTIFFINLIHINDDIAREKEGLLLGPQSRSFSHSFQSNTVPAENRDNVRIQPSRGKPNRTFRRPVSIISDVLCIGK